MPAQEHPVTVACKVLAVIRSSHYYRPTDSFDEAKLKRTIKKTAAEWPSIKHNQFM
jgi:hypothetical protein